VNLASRLEAATRPLAASIVISADTAHQAERESATQAEALLRGFTSITGLDVPGHTAVDVLALGR
jgi:class 3 adenylate cyclase